MSLPIPVNIAQSKNTTKLSVYTMGKKHYESTDWLGNVRVTYTDKKSWSNGKFALNVSSSQDYYPFGSVMEGRDFETIDYRFGFNGQHKVDEISGSGNHYTATHWEYDPRLVRRWNQDPKPNLSISNYAAFANNPIWYTDHDGDTIKIAYKNKTGLGKIFEKNKYMVYTPGMEYTGNNQFVSDAVNSLNYVYKNNADVHGIIKKSAESTEIVKVKKGNSDYYDPRKQTITWSKKGMTVWDNSSGIEVQGRQTGALGLFHELGHFYRHIFMPEDVDRDFGTPDAQYDNVEEKRVIEDYETPAARILGEGTRDNHSGRQLNTVSPTSTQTRREARKEARKNKELNR